MNIAATSGSIQLGFDLADPAAPAYRCNHCEAWHVGTIVRPDSINPHQRLFKIRAMEALAS